jgi:hypothetical protein
MPDYQIYHPKTVKRLKIKFSLSLPTPEDIAIYMQANGVLNRTELEKLQAQIVDRIKKAESGPVQKIVNQLYYLVKDRIKISPRTLYRLMANFDKFEKFMPNEFWMKVVTIIDKIGEHLYASTEKNP